MPRVRRRVLSNLDAPPDRIVAIACADLGLTAPDEAEDMVLTGHAPDEPSGRLQLRVVVPATADGPTAVEMSTTLHVPYFQIVFIPVLWLMLRRYALYTVRRIEAALGEAVAPEPPKIGRLLGPARFDDRQVNLLATAAAIGAIVSFGAALSGQFADPIARSFHASDASLTTALAVTRLGALVALVASALSDRQGRRRLLAVCFIGVCVGNLGGALSPNIEVFAGAQLLTRAFVNATIVIAGVAVVEDAPEGARAYAATLFALASGAGYGLSVVLLPVADVTPWAWRLVFGLSAATIVLLPVLMRTLPETRRYVALRARTQARAQLREVVDRAHRNRFVLLAGVAFLTSIFSAPSAQLTNRYLIQVHGFDNTTVALLKATTNGLPGLIGVVVGGYLAERKGRRPVAAIALGLGSLLQIAFFLVGGAWLWILSGASIVAAGAATLTIGTMDAELFPTEIRGTSNGLLLVCGVVGSVVGLVVAGQLADPLGGLGRALALCGLAPFLAAVFLVPRLPEAAHRELDELSPSEFLTFHPPPLPD